MFFINVKAGQPGARTTFVVCSVKRERGDLLLDVKKVGEKEDPAFPSERREIEKNRE